MNRAGLPRFIAAELPALCRHEPHGEAGYALPPDSLALLQTCVARLPAKRVFEFGSGQSTRVLLAAGCEVSVLEDSASWLSETFASLSQEERARLAAFPLPLRRVWLAGAPLRGWKLPEAALVALRAAELVLIDSPAWPPFREHALALALVHGRDALIVVDDANIPTVRRFCERMAAQNGVARFHTTMDHGLFFTHSIGTNRLSVRRDGWETLKAWRRYFLASRPP